MNARGTTCNVLVNPVTGAMATFDDVWICKPRHVEGTSAQQLVSGVAANAKGAMPHFYDADAHGFKDSSDFSCASILPDKASGNIVIMKFVKNKHAQLIASKILTLRDSRGFDFVS